jgi:hypothetical protein
MNPSALWKEYTPAAVIEEGRFLLLHGNGCISLGVKQKGEILFVWQSLETIEQFAYLDDVTNL